MYDTLKRIHEAKRNGDTKTADKLSRALARVGMDMMTQSILLKEFDAEFNNGGGETNEE